MRTLAIVEVAALAVLAACPCSATVIHVPADQGTIQAGIDAAAAGDTVEVACGTYYEYDIVMKSGVYLTSATGLPDCVTIDAQSLGNVLICEGVDAAASIVGFTLTNGQARTDYPYNGRGGGVYCIGSDPRFRHVTFTNSTASSRGGGMFCRESDSLLEDVSFTGNDPAGLWVSMYCSVAVDSATFAGNALGVYMDTHGGPFTHCDVTGSTFDANTSHGFETRALATFSVSSSTFTDHAAGAFVGAGASGSLTDCEFINNSDTAVYVNNGDLLRVQFTGNSGGSDGGGLHCSGETTLTDCSFIGNTGASGGGLNCEDEDATLTLEQVTFTGNSASSGGAMFTAGGTVEVRECEFTGNHATAAGAVQCNGPFSGTGSALFEDVTFDGNWVTGTSYDGGAMHCYYGLDLTLRDVVFSGNAAGTGAGGYGGGLYFYYYAGTSTLTLERVEFSGNTCGGRGGGLYTMVGGTMTDVAFVGNSADEGGGLYTENVGFHATLENCTFYQNTADDGGGAHIDKYVDVTGSTFAENSAPRGSGIYYNYSFAWGPGASYDNTLVAFNEQGEGLYLEDTYSGLPTLICCDIYGNDGGDWPAAISGQLGTNGNISEDPQFCGDANPTEPLTISTTSPCAPANSGGCGLIGAWPVACLPPENVVCDPNPKQLTATVPVSTVNVDYLGGGSDLLYGYSLTFTWDGTIAHTSVDSVAQGTLLSGAGLTFFDARRTGLREITVDCTLLGALDGSAGPGTMFTISFTGLLYGTSPIELTILEVRDRYNNPLTDFLEEDGELVVDVVAPTVSNVAIANPTLSHTNDFVKSGDGIEVTADVSDDDPTFGQSNITADLTGFGGGAAETPGDYVGGTATWTLGSAACSPLDGTVTVTVDATDAIGNAATPDSDDIEADNTLPDPVTGFDVEPGHELLVMSWDDPSTTDDNFYGVLVRYDDWDDYPYYNDPPPLYPADETEGEGDAYNDTGLVMYWEYDKTDRDVSYCSAFVYDWAMNYGPDDPGAQDRSTNYWLGDVAGPMGHWGSEPGYDYNGLVNDADFDKLAGTYAASNPVIPDAECDVGPTDDYSRVGIPEPDDVIGFEDLMILAMNYGVVAPRVVPFLPDEATKALSLELAELGASGEGMIEIALRLEGNASEVKGLSTVVGYDSTELEFVSARLSDDMSSPLAPVFFWRGSDDERVQIDLAVLGTDVTVGGSGDVAVLTFQALSEGYTLEFASVDLRNADNEQLVVEFEGIESKPEVPAAFRLVGNLPNPFNPVTKIAYDVPREAAVAIRIYDVSGRLVRTLVDQRIEPGRHEAVWTGRNETGEPVGSGVYFCTMDAEEFHGSHKMTLLK